MIQKNGLSLGSLFTPVRLGALVVPNRLVMAPMTRSRAGAGGVPTPLTATYYAQRASAGLIVTEAAHVSRDGIGYPGTPGIHTDDQVAGWSAVTNAVHGAGGRIFLQIWHVGRVSHPSIQPNGRLPVAPSAIAPEGQLYTVQGRQPFVAPRALEPSEIARVIADFARSAQLAREAGFDGVDLHAANGYLIDQFLRDGSNHRTDRYGGSVANRARFLLEVTEAVAKVWGADRIGVRLSPLNSYNSMADSDPMATFRHVAAELGRMEVAYLHVIEPGPGHPMATPAGCALLEALRVEFSGRFIVDGGRDRHSAESALAGCRADLVALATPFISNPDLVERLAQGLPLTYADPSTFYAGGARGYVDYPVYTQRAQSRTGTGV